MAGEYLVDKTNIKTLLFSKAIPNYNIGKVYTHGHKLFSCTDCGDRYILESSYNYHINRKSVKITYKCRHCNATKVFYNRCNLLNHIRSHAFKTATINISDLKVEPLVGTEAEKQKPKSIKTQVIKPTLSYSNIIICFECKKDITKTGIAYKDRATHYIQYTSTELYSCPVCLFALPTTCALRAHLRLHLKYSPYYCPECGIQLHYKSINYPYGHDCEGFKMMRATTRLHCLENKCHVFHPNEYISHTMTLHLKKIYKCPTCLICCYGEDDILKHLKSHDYGLVPVLFYQCIKYCGKLILDNQIVKHLRSHFTSSAYPCWSCGKVFKEAVILINHHIEKHSQGIHIKKELYESVLDNNKSLPTSNPTTFQEQNVSETHLLCHLCKNVMSQDWEQIKTHYKKFHKSHNCVDVKVILKRLDTRNNSLKKSKTLNAKGKKRIKKVQKDFENNMNDKTLEIPKIKSTCNICGYQTTTKKSFVMHMRSHKDPFMAYLCLECGQNFAVKPSFSNHLLLAHGISNASKYISKKKCYNENAFVQKQNGSNRDEKKTLKDNQCQICGEEFDNLDNLQKHFKVHGMAFLMKNANKGNNL